MNLKLIEILRNDPIFPNFVEVIRVAFKYKGLIVVVKLFDSEFPENVSVKLFDRPELYEKTKSFWNTQKVIEKEDNRPFTYRDIAMVAQKVFYKYKARLK